MVKLSPIYIQAVEAGYGITLVSGMPFSEFRTKLEIISSIIRGD